MEAGGGYWGLVWRLDRIKRSQDAQRRFPRRFSNFSDTVMTSASEQSNLHIFNLTIRVILHIFNITLIQYTYLHNLL